MERVVVVGESAGLAPEEVESVMILRSFSLDGLPNGTVACFGVEFVAGCSV